VPGGIAPGARIAGYVIEEQVGAGGMAVVFRARDEVLGRLAAIKVLAPALAADPEFRARFLRESRAVASVDEPHIIPVYGAGETEGMLYIATRFVAGGDLAALLVSNRGPLGPGRAAALIAQVASALDAAHRTGLVHRDVKPGNVLVDHVPGQDEHAYLTDFGITRGISSETGLTAAGQFMGTPDYCAPEQIRGRQVDGRTDQYALGCVAFVLLAGVPPFHRSEAVATLFAHLNDPIPAATGIRPGLPRALDPVLAKAMAKEPQDRYASCGEFAAELRDALASAAPGRAHEAAVAEAGPREEASPHGADPEAPDDAKNGSRHSGSRGPQQGGIVREHDIAPVPLRSHGPTLPASSTGQVKDLHGDTMPRQAGKEGFPPPQSPPFQESSGRAEQASRRRTAALAGSAALILAAAGILTALLLPGSTHGTGSLAPPTSSTTSSLLPTSSATSSASPSPASPSPASLSGTLTASGSTFQTSFQEEAISNFRSIDPGISVAYGGGGSGKGRTDLAGGTVQYAGSDSPIPANQQSLFAGKTVLYFPVQIGPIAIAYNLPGVKNLKLDPAALAGIFSGNIKTWDDPAIKALNPGVTLPSSQINVVVRADSSGTTANFTQYLVDAAGSAWTLGTGSTISFPSTVHAVNGGPTVAGAVASTSGSIGYVDNSTATKSNLSTALIKNKDGKFVGPSTAGATAAASQVTPAANLTFSTVDEPGADSYPITYQSWDLVYAKQPNASTASLLKAYLGYLLGAGQQLLPPLGLAPLPSSIDAKAVAQLSQITS
jgi:serine/threonine-protein kinase